MGSAAASASPPEREAKRKSGRDAFGAGAAAGMVTSALLQPFDVIKTRLQAQAAGKALNGGMVSIAQTIARTEGVRALWSGVGPACIRVGGGAGLYFLCLSKAQQALEKRWPQGADGKSALPMLRTFALGAASRATAAFVFCPITVVKTRMEYAAMSGVAYRNTAHALVTIARQERLRGLFSGLGPTLLRDAPYSGIYLLLFTRLRSALDSDSSPAVGFVAGALAGGMATLVTHPPDVMRTRLQLRRNALLAGGAAPQDAAALPALRLRDIVRTEGIGALWSGITPRIARRTLQQAMTWTLFEFWYQGRLV